MSKSLPIDADYYLWLLLAHTRHAISKARQKELRRYNLSSRQAAILAAIDTIGDTATPAEIARWAFREPHTISELLFNLERRGIVKKVKDLGKKNQVRVVLTDKGREVYRQVSKRASIHRIMSFLPDEERQQLKSCLEKLLASTLNELGIGHKLHFPFSTDSSSD